MNLNEHGMIVDPTRPWLGGYFPEGDAASWCPQLWDWAIERFAVKSMIDVGCGAGRTLDWFAVRGCRVLGVDGLPPPGDDRIIEHDYTTGPLMTSAPFDLAWSCEFVEHVAEEYIPNYLDTFRRARIVMMTHAMNWQSGGHHHVTMKPPGFWIDLLQGAGFTLLARESLESHDLVQNHYWGRSGLIFERL